MRLGIRAKLLLVSLAIIALALLGGGAWLEHELRLEEETRISQQLERTTRTAREAVIEAGAGSDPATLEELSIRLAKASGARITVIAHDGHVIADSGIDPAGVTRMENHAERPEVVDALRSGLGSSRRASATLGDRTLYMAVPFGEGPSRGVVRAAISLRDVEHSVAHLRSRLLAGGALAMLVSAAMSLFAAQMLTATIRRLLSAARSMAAGESKLRLEASSGDELGVLAGSVNQLANALESTVAELARERDRADAVLEALAEAVVAVDFTGQVIVCNQSARKLMPSTPEPVGRPLVELVRQPELHELVAQARERTTGTTVELRMGRTTVLARASLLRYPEGAVLVVMRDVTELRRLEGVRRDFVANVSHELRTPVSVIRANAEALAGGALSDPVHGERFVGALLRNAERLSRIIGDLLDLSRIEAGEYAIDLQPVSARAAALRAIEAVSEKAKDRRLRVEAPEDVIVVADDQALEHVLVNLLDNAVKYTSDGGTITVRAEAEDGRVRIEVEDDGPGIEPRYRERVFERFYRVDPGRSRELGGTGLGLSIVRNLVQAMDGAVGVRGAEPKGSVFWFTLPKGRAHSAADVTTASQQCHTR